jgi:hypothetical protein
LIGDLACNRIGAPDCSIATLQRAGSPLPPPFDIYIIPSSLLRKRPGLELRPRTQRLRNLPAFQCWEVTSREKRQHPDHHNRQPNEHPALEYSTGEIFCEPVKNLHSSIIHYSEYISSSSLTPPNAMRSKIIFSISIMSAGVITNSPQRSLILSRAFETAWVGDADC